MVKININFDHFAIKNYLLSGVIRSCVNAVLHLEQVKAPCEINILITNDQGIRAINNASRNIDKATDVLSFPMFELKAGEFPEDYNDMLDPETGLCPLGDMAISLERASAQAKAFGHSVRREVGYLTIHSMLHLLGYDHMDEGEMKKQMRKREEEIAKTVTGVHR